MNNNGQTKEAMESYEQRKEVYRQLIKSYRLIDDTFMSSVFDGFIEGTTLLLRIILGKHQLKVLEVTRGSVKFFVSGVSLRDADSA